MKFPDPGDMVRTSFSMGLAYRLDGFGAYGHVAAQERLNGP